MGAGCQIGWAHCEVKVSPNGNRVPGGEKNPCESKNLARACRFSVGEGGERDEGDKREGAVFLCLEADF